MVRGGDLPRHEVKVRKVDPAHRARVFGANAAAHGREDAFSVEEVPITALHDLVTRQAEANSALECSLLLLLVIVDLALA